MKKKSRDILLQDLCARLPYGVKINNEIQGDFNIYGICENFVFGRNEVCHIDFDVEKIKPYLFPLSSMTEEQKEELFKLCEFCIREDWEGKKSEVYAIEIASRFDPAYCYDHNFNLWNVDMRAIDWLNKNHFDYRGLIEKSLALDATNLNIY